MLIQSPSPLTLTPGALGEMTLAPGWYIYVGSAFGPGGLRARCSRHSRRQKPVRWHIDYLTRHLAADEIWYSDTPTKLEHQWAAYFRQRKDLKSTIKNFGAGDCRCESHLFHFLRKPSFRTFQKTFTAETFRATCMD